MNDQALRNTSSLASSMPANTAKTTKTRCQNEMPISEEQQEIKDKTQGKKFLDKHLLLWPAGEPALTPHWPPVYTRYRQ
jgi:hypothetical protein